MLELCAPIYTVHDNFITPYLSTRKIPRIYSNVFSRLGAPLSINKLINMNIIEPTFSNYMDVIDVTALISSQKEDWFSNIQPHCYHTVSEPIPHDHLRAILYNLIPKGRFELPFLVLVLIPVLRLRYALVKSRLSTDIVVEQISHPSLLVDREYQLFNQQLCQPNQYYMGKKELSQSFFYYEEVYSRHWLIDESTGIRSSLCN
ncbi:DNA-directed RNA polymerase [Striga asiatica]|uniref:DNA-directed RNA polymerase n=1 Tax=Striga asiatica TaxID=4170 RepID=A0A5A7QKN5_STRAF|nr:DNA-directed RNA polymerase [Striga asiatica]